MLPVWAWVLVALVLAITVLALLHYFANPNFIDVKGRAYLITGGSSGIGKAVAKDILSKGGSVALVARKQAGLDEAQAELAGGDEGVRARISLHAADIMDEEAVKAAVEGAADAHGRLDGVVSSAGTSLPRLFEAISAEQWEWMLRLNVVGTRNVIAASLPHLKASDAGRIVMVSSSAGQVGVFGFTLYSASKFALSGFAQALAQELRIFNIGVTVFFPPDTETPLLARENQSKPVTCAKISEGAGLETADTVGRALVQSMRHGWAVASAGLLPDLLTVGSYGASHWTSLYELLVSSAAAGLVRFILGCLHFEWNGYISKYAPGDYAAAGLTQQDGQAMPQADEQASGTAEGESAAAAEEDVYVSLTSEADSSAMH